MTEYLIDWSISGTTRVIAGSPEEAQSIFDGMSNREHADEGELEVYGEPETQIDRHRRRRQQRTEAGIEANAG